MVSFCVTCFILLYRKVVFLIFMAQYRSAQKSGHCRREKSRLHSNVVLFLTNRHYPAISVCVCVCGLAKDTHWEQDRG